MFSSARSVTIIFSLVLILLIAIFGSYYRNVFTESILKRTTEAELEVISNTYIRTVWSRYYPVINFLDNRPKNEWDIYSQYSAFILESTLALTSSNILNAIIYDRNGNQVFTTNKEVSFSVQKNWLSSLLDIDKSDINSQDLRRQNQMAGILLPSILVKQGTTTTEKTILKVFIPLNINKQLITTEGDSSGMLEIFYDISAMTQPIYKAYYYLILSFSLLLSILISIVFIASKKAEELIEKQQEASTEMAAAKASAEAESRAKSQFLANVTHELRTPLNAIIGFSEIINSESMGPINNNQYKEFIKDIHTSGVHLLSLINDILDFSKAEVNKLDVTLEQIDLTKAAKLCLRMVAPRAEEAKVKLVEEMPQEHIVLMLDQKRIKQIILNILSNAVKFTPEAGQISLKIWKDNKTNTAGIEIKDTGVGMAPQDLARALSPFGQVDNKLSRKYEGTGLGLPLTKKLVELMKGKFDIKSETGIGTTVTITFPLALSVEPTITSGQVG